MAKKVSLFIKGLFRILIKTALILFFIFLVLSLVFHVPWVQQELASLVLSKVEEKVDAPVSIDGIAITFPNRVKVSGIYAAGPHGDTLVFANKIKVNIQILKLLQRQLAIDLAEIQDAKVRLVRSSDSVFNFQHYIDAFSGSDTLQKDEPDTAKGKFQFEIAEIKLSGIRFLFADSTNKGNYSVELGELELAMKTLDPQNKKIGIENIFLAKTQINISSPISPGTSQPSKPMEWDIGLEDALELENVGLYLNIPENNMRVEMVNINLKAKAHQLDLPNYQIDLDEVSLKNTRVAIIQNGNAPGSGGPATSAENTDDPLFPWKVKCENFVLEGNTIAMTNNAKPKAQTGIDYAHLHASNINGAFKKIALSPNHLQVSIEGFAFEEKSGFTLNELSTYFHFSEKQAQFKNFMLETPATRVAYDATISYASIDQLRQSPMDVAFSLDLETLALALTDLLYFQPSLADSLQFIQHGQMLHASGSIKGGAGSADIQDFHASYEQTRVNVRGTVKNWDNINQLYADLTLGNLETSRDNILMFVPDTAIPSNVSLPEKIKIKGSLKGSMAAFKATSDLESGYGNASFQASLSPSDSLPDKRGYSANFSLDGLDMGAILSTDTIGTLHLKADVKGTIDKDSLTNPDADIHMQLDQFDLMGYTYKDMVIDGNYRNRYFKGDASINDTNLIFNFKGTVDLADSVPEFDFHFNLLGADLQALHLTQQPIGTRGSMAIDLMGGGIDQMNGHVKISNLLVVKEGQQYEMDSIIASIKNEAHTVELNLQSRPVQANYEGSVKLGELVQTMQRFIDPYFNLNNNSIGPINPSKQFKWTVKVLNTDFITQVLFDDIESFMPATISGDFSAQKNKLNVKANFPHVNYKGNTVDALQMEIVTTDSATLDYSVGFEKINYAPFVISKTVVQGSIANNRAQFAFKMTDRKGEDKYLVNGHVYSEDDRYRLHILPDNLVIHYNTFTLPEENAIAFGENGTKLTNIDLQSGQQQIKVTRVEGDTALHSAYKISLDQFGISNITGAFEARQDLVNGAINGDIVLKQHETGSNFSAQLTANQVTFFSDTAFEEIHIDIQQPQSDILQLDAQFSGRENDLSLKGKITGMDEQGQLDMILDVGKLDLAHFAPFAKSEIKELKGHLQGRIEIKGESNLPSVTGQLSIRNATINPSYLNTTFKIPDETLTLNNHEISFNNFTLLDVQENKTTLNGTVNYEQLDNPVFDLSLSSNNFQYLNSSYQQNDLFYGKVVAGLEANITGTAANPVVTLDADIGNATHFHVVVPALNTPSIEKQGIVRFIDKDSTAWNQIIERSLALDDSLLLGSGQLIDLTANIGISKGTKITIVIDPISNEELMVSGNANLSFSMKGGGTPSLTGRFEIAEGSYTLMLYDVIRRTFDLKEGSNLQWNGELLNARTDITALYNVRTSRLPLIQATGATTQQSQQSSDIMPFIVNLHITGFLLQPEIDFSLSVPQSQSDATIQAHLSQLNQDESELNKQVFSLLLFNSFMQTGATAERSVEYELSSTARTSVSRLLTQQINNFAQRHIKGFDVGVDVNSYHMGTGNTASGRTDVSLDVSKQLFNNRLSVKVGGDINVEGPERQTEQDFNSIAGDVVVEYKLDRNGNYRLKGFNVTEYEDIIDGEVNKTGVSFIYNKDFYKIGNLFKKDTAQLKVQPQNEKNE
jgi:translocation and assembly module TamB